MLPKLRAATVAVLLTTIPMLGEAQRLTPVFRPFRSGQSMPRVRQIGSTERTARVAVDSGAVRDKTPYVLAGAILGAIAGGFLYRRELDRMGGEDFTAPYSIAVYVGAGAGLGALLGYLVGSFGEPPAKLESGYRPIAPAQR